MNNYFFKNPHDQQSSEIPVHKLMLPWCFKNIEAKKADAKCFYLRTYSITANQNMEMNISLEDYHFHNYIFDPDLRANRKKLW